MIKLWFWIILLVLLSGCATYPIAQSPYPVEQRINDYFSLLDKMHQDGQLSQAELLAYKNEMMLAYENYKVNQRRTQAIEQQGSFNNWMSIMSNLQKQQQLDQQQKVVDLYTTYPGLVTMGQRTHTNCYQIGNSISCDSY